MKSENDTLKSTNAVIQTELIKMSQTCISMEKEKALIEKKYKNVEPASPTKKAVVVEDSTKWTTKIDKLNKEILNKESLLKSAQNDASDHKAHVSMVTEKMQKLAKMLQTQEAHTSQLELQVNKLNKDNKEAERVQKQTLQAYQLEKSTLMKKIEDLELSLDENKRQMIDLKVKSTQLNEQKVNDNSPALEKEIVSLKEELEKTQDEVKEWDIQKQQLSASISEKESALNKCQEKRQSVENKNFELEKKNE